MDQSSLREHINQILIEKRRKIHGRRILAFLIAIVLSGTTAAMIMPAGAAGMDVFSSAEGTPMTVSGNEISIPEKEETVSGNETMDPLAGLTASMPVQSFRGEAGEVRVLVEAGEGIFPEGTTMRVLPVDDDQVLNSVRETASQDMETAGAFLAAVAVDISFWNRSEEEIQPVGELQVTLTSDVIAHSSELAVVHVADSGDSSIMNTLTEKELDQEPADNEVVFLTDSFSAYALVYSNRASSDLGQYITAVESFKKVNGVWKKLDENSTGFVAGDEADFRIHYSIPAGSVIPDKTLTYQVSGNIVLPTDGLKGFIYNPAHKEVGTYDISSTGFVTMKFYEDFNTNEEALGYLNFSGLVKNDSDTEDAVISFKDNINVVVHPKKQDTNIDLKGSKTASFKKGDNYISYEIKVSSTTGTNRNLVTVYDILQGDGIDVGYGEVYDLKVVDGSGRTLSGYTVTDGKNESSVWSGHGFAVKNLPALGQNGTYTLTYKVRVDESKANSEDGRVRVRNWMKGVSGPKETTDGGYTEQYVLTEIVNKRSEKVTVDGKKMIRWVVTVNKRDASDYLIKDTLTVTGGTPVTLPSGFTVKMPNGSTQAGSFQNGAYTLRGGEGQYEITYLTEAPTGNEGAKVETSNTAEVTANHKTYKSTAVDVENMPTYQYGVTKKSPAGNEVVETAQGAELLWHVGINLPSSGVKTESMLYTDNLSAVNDSKGGEAIGGAHYTTAAQLNASLVIQGPATGTLRVGQDYRIYDSNGNDITGSGATTALEGFQIRFQDSLLDRLKDTSLNITYKSTAKSGQSSVGETWSYINKGSIPGHTAEDKISHTKTGGVDKKASNDGVTYTNENVEVDYTTGKIYYQVQVKMYETAEIVLKDTLAEGLKFVPNHLTATYYQYNADGSWESPIDWSWGNNRSSASLNEAVQTDIQGQTMTMRIPSEFTHGGSQIGIRLRYEAEIDDEFWADKRHTMKVYANRVEWGDQTDVTETTVTHQEEVITKDAKESLDTMTGMTKSVEYSLVVNPQALDLVSSGNTITLKDTLSISEDDSEATLDLASLKVYAYDPKAEDHRGELINADRYSYQVNTFERSFTLKLPDELAMVVAYSYDITLGLNTPTLSNTATIEGVGGAHTGHALKLNNSSSSAGLIQQKLTVYKVDSENYRVTLPGVTFSLKKLAVGTDGSVSWQDGGSPVTGERGEMTFDPSLSGAAVQRGVLYQLTETFNPIPGYADISGTSPYYFVFNRPGISNQETYTKSGAEKAGIDQKNIRFVTYAEALYIPNVNKSITVQKVWLNADNSDMENPGTTADVILYRRKQALKTATVTIHLRELNQDYPSTPNLTEEQKEAKRNRLHTIVVPLNSSLNLQLGGSGTGAKMSYNNNDYYHGSGEEIPIGVITGDTTVLIEGRSGSATWAWLDKYTFGYTVDNHKEWETVGEPEEVARVTLNATDKWRHTWTELLTQDASGQPYYYYVEEIPVSGFTTTYSDNNVTGIPAGTITVTNQKNESSEYVLPATGGRGTMPYALGGISLILMSLFLYTNNKKNQIKFHMKKENV